MSNFLKTSLFVLNCIVMIWGSFKVENPDTAFSLFFFGSFGLLTLFGLMLDFYILDKSNK